MSYDPFDDDGVAVMVSFEGPAGDDTVGVYIDHNLGGMAKDAFAVPAGVDEVIRRLKENDELDAPEYRQIPLSEAAARWRAAFEMTDMTLEPPTTEDLDQMRALVLARLTRMPSGGRVPQPPPVDEAERDRLLSQFLESDETIGLWHDDEEEEAVCHLAMQVMTFSLDYVEGTQLRFSPVMVEHFCLDWAPRKIAADDEAFTLLPDLLAEWIRFAGRHRGIPQVSIDEAAAAAYGYAPEMIELAKDQRNWGPAKTMALAIEQRGIDITDQAALDDFIDEVNRNGGIDVLADSLAGRGQTKRRLARMI